MDLSSTFTVATAPRQRVRRALPWLLLVLAVVVVGFGAWRYMARPAAVDATLVRRGPVTEVVYATGFVEPRSPVEVSSRVTAPVTAVLVDEGDRVVRGQPLALLDAEDQRHNVAQLAAERANAEQDERRALQLFSQGWSTRAARDRAVATANTARAAEAAARARLDQFAIRSGISGVVLRRDVEPGDLATAAKTMFAVGDPQSLRVTATVDERDIALVRKGAQALMTSDAYPDRIIRGRVYDITPAGDPDQRAFRIRIVPDNVADLPIGLTLEVNVVASEKPRALLVPASAIRDGAVWAVEGGRLKRVAVRTGVRGATDSEIRGGVAAGACVLRDPSPGLKDGARAIAKGC